MVTKVGVLLLLLSTPFFLGTGFEMYVLTGIAGPQSLGFSWVHRMGLVGLCVMGVSALSFLALGIYSIAVLCFRHALNAAGSDPKLFAWILGVQVVHAALLVFYRFWSPLFSG